MRLFFRLVVFGAVVLGLARVAVAQEKAGVAERPRARAVGVAPGVLDPGPLNAITDVAGVAVGHVTLRRGDSVRTGVTAVLPHGGNLYQEKVPAGVAVGNGFGKLTGTTQIRELGEIETPLVLTNTLSVPEAMAGVVEWTLAQPGNEQVRSVNAVAGETNDGYLNAIRARVIEPAHVIRAIEKADGDLPAEGAVGAGTGTVAFGWKGGIGTSSRVVPQALGGYTVGVLVQTNYGGLLRVLGVPVGEALGQYYLQDYLQGAVEGNAKDDGEADDGEDGPDGSVMIVVTTDAPLSDRNLERLAHRSLIGIGRTGSPMTNGSGDYALAFSTAKSVRRTPARREGLATYQTLPNRRVSPLFQAAVEATEEAVYNSLFKATTTRGHRGTVEALPVERVLDVLREHGRLE